MPTLESLHLAEQATQLLANVRRDIRASCNDYKVRLDRNEFTAAYVRTLANGQGQAILGVLQRLADHRAAVEAALLEWSIPVNDTRGDYNQLRQAAEAMRDATAANVAATLAQILTQVTPKTRLW